MNNRGFSLLEALIALAILSGVITTALSIASSSTQRSAEALGEFRAFLMADAILQRTGSELALTPSHTSGRFADGSSWQLSIAQLDNGGSTSALPTFEVKAQVEPAAGAPVVLTTLMGGAR